MKVIGHRGAAGLAPENTVASIREASDSNVDVIEFDVRQTKDHQLVLCHDASLLRTYKIDKNVADLNFKDLRKLCPDLPTLEEALEACKCPGVVVELKEAVPAKQLIKSLSRFPELDIAIASFSQQAIRAVKEESPKQFCALLQHRKWPSALKTINELEADGLGLHYAAMNPILYFIARHRKLELYVYTVDRPWLAKIYSYIYPGIGICTNIPDKIR